MARLARMVGVVAFVAASCGDAPGTPLDAGAFDAGEYGGDVDGGDIDGGDVDGGDMGTADTCVSVVGAGVTPWLDLQIVGREFDAYENARIRVVVGSAGRVGVAHTQVRDGAFELELPRTFNDGLYNEIGLYIDDDRNDACDVGEQQWGYVSGITVENLRIDATPEMLCVSGGGPEVGAGCRPWNEQPEACYVDGPVDLRIALACPQ